jgi:spore maturation protein CgeB
VKFLIPNFCPADSFVDNVSHTLRKMGHEVVNMGVVDNSYLVSPYRRLYRSIQGRITGEQFTKQEKWLRKNFLDIKPDVVLALTQALDAETLGMLREQRITTVSWWGDTAANMKNKGLLQDGWDLVFIKDQYAAHKLKTVGLPAHQLYEAMNPDWHKVLSAQQNNSLVIAGSFYDYRHYLVTKMMRDGVEMALYGGRLPRWSNPGIRSMHTGKYIVREEKSKVFGAALGVLNSTAMSEFDSVNCRAFEAAGCGSLQVMEYRPAIENCFEPGKEILVYRSYDELLDIIKKAISHPQEMKGIRQAAAARALAHHTYTIRLNTIIGMIQERR